MEFKEIKGKSLVQMAVDQIFTHIVAGGLNPGDCLPMEARLAQSFGISKATTREALRTLESRGIIQVVPRKHILIKEIPAELLEAGHIDLAINLGPGHLPELLDSLPPILGTCAWMVCRNHTQKELHQFRGNQ